MSGFFLGLAHALDFAAHHGIAEVHPAENAFIEHRCAAEPAGAKLADHMIGGGAGAGAIGNNLHIFLQIADNFIQISIIGQRHRALDMGPLPDGGDAGIKQHHFLSRGERR